MVAHFRPHRKWLIKLGFGPVSKCVLYQMLLHHSIGCEPESQHGVQTLRCIVEEHHCHSLESFPVLQSSEG